MERKDVEKMLELVTSELLSATKKFGSFHSTHEGYAVIYEELDELWDAVKDNNLPQACREAVQVAAMGMRFAIDISNILKARAGYDVDYGA